MPERQSEAEHLEELWGGDFGDAYSTRNREAGEGRGGFWGAILTKFPVGNVLEVGCNIGGNLRWIRERVPANHIFGVDINDGVLRELCRALPGVNAVRTPARELPFCDRWFDLVFTTGVLIHQPPEILPVVMAEIVRCSRRYVVCGEYFAEVPTQVPYRGQSRALWKQDFGGLYQTLFPGLVLLEKGFLPRDRGGWDDVTYWVFEKPA